MAGAFTKANASALSERLGRSPSEGELYIAHFLGAGGAARLITLAAADPSAKAADFFPNAAQANSPIFYDRATGAARSVAQVRNILTARYDVARGNQDRATFTAQADPRAAQAAPASATAAAPDTAGIANAFAAAVPTPKADNNQVFHSLFADSNRAAPLAPVVSALWSVPNAAPSASGTAPKLSLIHI